MQCQSLQLFAQNPHHSSILKKRFESIYLFFFRGQMYSLYYSTMYTYFYLDYWNLRNRIRFRIEHTINCETENKLLI